MTDADPDVLDALDGPDRLLCALRALELDVYDTVTTEKAKKAGRLVLDVHPDTAKKWLYALRDAGVMQTLVRGDHAVHPSARTRLDALPAAAVDQARRRIQ